MEATQELGTSCAGAGKEGGGGGGGSPAAAPSRDELLALLAARDATLAALEAELGERRRLMERPGVRAALLGERLLDVLPIVAAMGFAAEVAHCLFLCGETWRKGDRGATNDMLVRSLERQCGARAARAAEREDYRGYRDTTQLIRAAMNSDLPRVLQLVQLGAPLELREKLNGSSALRWACQLGDEHVARALLDGKYEGRGAEVDARYVDDWTPLMWASFKGQEGVVRLLLARGARQELQGGFGNTALHSAVENNHADTVALLCAAPGAAAALALRDELGRTPLGVALARNLAACAAVLRAHGALR
jgi:hypothetical protein